MQAPRRDPGTTSARARPTARPLPAAAGSRPGHWRPEGRAHRPGTPEWDSDLPARGPRSAPRVLRSPGARGERPPRSCTNTAERFPGDTGGRSRPLLRPLLGPARRRPAEEVAGGGDGAEGSDGKSRLSQSVPAVWPRPAGAGPAPSGPGGGLTAPGALLSPAGPQEGTRGSGRLSQGGAAVSLKCGSHGTRVHATNPHIPLLRTWCLCVALSRHVFVV